MADSSIWHSITEVLQWLLPTGGVLGLIWWYYTKMGKDLQALRDSHDTYKAMYQDVSETLKDEVSEKRKLRLVLARLEKALSKMSQCKYIDDCPVDRELRRASSDDDKNKPNV